jgi:hypothetical protein
MGRQPTQGRRSRLKIGTEAQEERSVANAYAKCGEKKCEERDLGVQ